MDREPATVAEREAAMALGEHIFECDECDSLTGFRCETGRMLLDRAQRASRACHEARKGRA